MFHKLRYIIKGRVGPFILIEDTFSYTRKECVGKQISPKEIPLGTGDPLKETKNVLEDENDKQVHTIIGGILKKKEIPRDKMINRYARAQEIH